MYLQPVVVLESGQVHRFEALARLVTAEGEVLAPYAFLPTLSSQGIDRLFRIGLEQVLGDLARWDRAGLVTAVSLNVSPTTLRHTACVDWVVDALARHGLGADRLLLEVLEDSVIDSPQQHEALLALQEHGVGVVMDDLGVGYSTLARLTRFPFLGAKIDRSYVAAMDADPVAALARLTALVRLADEIGWDLAVEGIETVGAAEAVVAIGAARAQGYLFARPMPPAEVPDFLASFSCPVDGRRVTTPLGALAHHFDPAGVAGGPVETCPVTPFLAAQPDAAAAARWHADLHAELPVDPTDHHPAGASRPALVDWLVRSAASASSASA